MKLSKEAPALSDMNSIPNSYLKLCFLPQVGTVRIIRGNF